MTTFTTWAPEETMAFGAGLAQYLDEGDFVALDGGLAAGKTCLVQGMAGGLGYDEAVTSPTFTLLHLYETGRLPLYHFDVYRLAAPEELEGLGYEDYFYGSGICVVEWGSLVADYLPERRIGITMDRLESVGMEGRRITVAAFGGEASWRAWLLQKAAEVARQCCGDKAGG